MALRCGLGLGTGRSGSRGIFYSIYWFYYGLKLGCLGCRLAGVCVWRQFSRSETEARSGRRTLTGRVSVRESFFLLRLKGKVKKKLPYSRVAKTQRKAVEQPQKAVAAGKLGRPARLTGQLGADSNSNKLIDPTTDAQRRIQR